MGKVKARVEAPGRVFEAEQLWYDTSRWPAFIDGFHHVDRLAEGWPQEVGARVRWVSTPGGRGLVVEEVVAYEARVRLQVRVDDEAIRGMQTITFEPLGGDRVAISLELDYVLKSGRPLDGVKDVLFIRRAQREALQRTLNRFGRELQADREGI